MEKLANLKGVKTLNKNEQKSINGDGKGGPCPCTSNYTNQGGGSCSYPALFPGGFVCFGTIQNGLCCV